MSNNQLTADSSGKQISRPLSVLVPLIKQDLQQGNDAAKTASEPYYKAAGEKMIEAKSQMKQGEFRPWIKKNFDISDTHATRYMAYARATSGAQNARFENFSDFMRKEGGDPTYGKVTRQREWHEPVKESIEQAKQQAARIQDENLTREREREEQIKLCLRMVDIGYKILSKELHPDKGGSREAMIRLNDARKYAKARLI